MFILEILLEPLAYVKNIQKKHRNGGWDSILSEIHIEPSLPEESLWGIDQFSHLEIIYFLSGIAPDSIEWGARHPRNNMDWPQVGIFAQRGKNRPNRLALTTVKLRALQGRVLYVEGCDALDGTPVLDIKPVMQGFLPRGAVQEPSWATELMREYW